jgi:hypothetical protein
MSCHHIYLSGRHKGEQCEIVPESGNYCYKHKRDAHKRPAGAQAIAEDAVFGHAGAAPVAKKMRYSNWYITLNSNKDISKMTAADKLRFKQFCDFVFTEDGIKRFITDSTAADHANIVKLEISHYFEAGDEQGRLHMHGLLAVEHTGNLRLEANRIRAAARAALGYDVYFNSPVSTDHAKAYAEYVKKQAAAVKI